MIYFINGGRSYWEFARQWCVLFMGQELYDYGTHEVMIAYAHDMKEHAKKCGVPVKFHIGEGMMHCWCAMEMTPEGKQARQDIFQMINREGKEG